MCLINKHSPRTGRNKSVVQTWRIDTRPGVDNSPRRLMQRSSPSWSKSQSPQPCTMIIDICHQNQGYMLNQKPFRNNSWCNDLNKQPRRKILSLMLCIQCALDAHNSPKWSIQESSRWLKLKRSQPPHMWGQLNRLSPFVYLSTRAIICILVFMFWFEQK